MILANNQAEDRLHIQHPLGDIGPRWGKCPPTIQSSETMVNGAISSDEGNVTNRLIAIERDSKWQSLFTRLSFTALLAVGIAYVAVTAIIIFQMSDLNVGLTRLTDQVGELHTGQVQLENKFDALQNTQNMILQSISPQPDKQGGG